MAWIVFENCVKIVYSDTEVNMMGLNRAKLHIDHFYPEKNLVLGPYIVWQAGNLLCEPGYTVDAHVQEVHEISYIASGHGVFVLNGVEYPVRKGDVFIDRIRDNHAVISSEYDPLRFFYIGFDFKQPVLSEVTHRVKEFWDHFTNPLLSGIPNVQEAFIDFLSEIDMDDFLSLSLMEGYLQRIICEIYRHAHRNLHIGQRLNADQSGNEKLVSDIVQYLETHINQMHKLSELCSVFGYSYSHISGCFRTVIGETLSTYFLRRRLECSQNNMRRGMSITEVAEAAGYKSIHAFSRAYKRLYGVPPKEFKDALHTAESTHENM